jgi:hypothetical protein
MNSENNTDEPLIPPVLRPPLEPKDGGNPDGGDLDWDAPGDVQIVAARRSSIG